MKHLQQASITHMMLRKDRKNLDITPNRSFEKSDNQTDIDQISSKYFEKVIVNDEALTLGKFAYCYDQEYYFFTKVLPETASELFSFATTLPHTLDEVIYLAENNSFRLTDKTELTKAKLKVLTNLAHHNYQPALDYFLHQVIYHHNIEARKQLKFHKFNLLGFPIYLPRLFKGNEDFHKLGTSLIIRKDSAKGQNLKGDYFELEVGIKFISKLKIFLNHTFHGLRCM